MSHTIGFAMTEHHPGLLFLGVRVLTEHKDEPL